MKTRKTIWMAAVAVLMICGGCSRPKSEPVNIVSPASPNSNLKHDAELLREATTKAAEARKREEAAAIAKAAGASPAPTSMAPGTPQP